MLINQEWYGDKKLKRETRSSKRRRLASKSSIIGDVSVAQKEQHGTKGQYGDRLWCASCILTQHLSNNLLSPKIVRGRECRLTGALNNLLQMKLNNTAER